MSHSRERTEKICLNCGTGLNGRFCHKCGQENVEPKHSFLGLITHFFNDITHFDGKFFVTAKYLVRRPGFLPKEYSSGRRASYLDPIRMYLFSSAAFFLILYSLSGEPKVTAPENDRQQQRSSADSSKADQRTGPSAELTDSVLEGDSSDPNPQLDNFNISRTFDKYPKVRAYDSVQASLADDQKAGWLERTISRKLIRYKEVYGERTDEELRKELTDKFIHSLPSLLFISLPLFALYLKLLYIRHKKTFYVEHVIFLIYLYIFTFIVFLIYFGLNAIKSHWWDSGWMTVPETALFIYGVIYTLTAMRRFYNQGWSKTFVKFIILNILASISLTILAVAFFGFAFYRL